MKSCSPLFLLILVVGLVHCAPPDATDGGTVGKDAGTGGVDGGASPSALPLADLPREAARATCDALFRCCPSSDDLAQFFSPIAFKDPMGDFADIIPRLPPNAPLDAAGCPALVEDIYRVGIDTLGAWVALAEQGVVTYDADAAQACVSRLDDATCGESMREALFDGTCFALYPPSGGDRQRSYFRREAGPGESCQAIRDGFGGRTFGTCDPTASFCCFPGPDGNCGLLVNDEGVCQPIAAPGAACSFVPPLQLCATGIDCAVGMGPGGADGCVVPATTPLSPGEACYDNNAYIALGECVGGYCDLLGTGTCQAQKADGASCLGGEECSSGACEDEVCGESTVCTGG